MARASDAARDAATERLKDAYVRGALTIEELHGRVSAALVAPTAADLASLTSDVPGDTRSRTLGAGARGPAQHVGRSVKVHTHSQNGLTDDVPAPSSRLVSRQHRQRPATLLGWEGVD